jgi:queuine tRNA-ribosyltransferase
LLGVVEVDAPAASVRELAALPFDGLVVSGVARIADKSERRAALEGAIAALPEGALRVVDWRDSPAGLRRLLDLGVDLVRLPFEAERARSGVVLSDEGEHDAAAAAWREDRGPLVEGCACATCRSFNRAYVRHLLVADELLAFRLIERHNLERLVGATRASFGPRSPE